MLKEANAGEGVQKWNGVAESKKHDTKELILQIEFEIKANEINEANRYMPYAQTKSTNMTTFQWPPELGWEEDEAPLSALSALVS